MIKRDQDILRKRAEEKTETPKAITLDDLVNVEAVDIDNIMTDSNSETGLTEEIRKENDEAWETIRENSSSQENSIIKKEEPQEEQKPEILTDEKEKEEEIPEKASAKSKKKKSSPIQGHSEENPENTEKPITNTLQEKKEEAPPSEESDHTSITSESSEQVSSSLEAEDTQENQETSWNWAESPSENTHPETEGKPERAWNQHVESLYEKVNAAKTLFARWRIDEARAIIIEWLALKKDHRDLNLLLGEIYESEGRIPQAEIVYKDLAHVYHDDPIVLSRLASILVIEKNYTIAYEIYKKILSIWGDEEDTLYILVHLAQEMSLPNDVHTYAKLYLKQWPNNKDILFLYSEAQISLGMRKEAIATLIKLKNLSPYNAHEISDMINKLLTEEEMAENFWETRAI